MFNNRQIKQLLIIVIIIFLLGIIGLDTYLSNKIEIVDQQLIELENDVERIHNQLETINTKLERSKQDE